MPVPQRICTTWAARTATDETSKSVGRHHSKGKGDLGVAKAHADLVGKGFYVLFPATEHAPFDLVAYAAGTFHRIQVKYRSARAGAVRLNFRSTWADRRGAHSTPIDKDAIDVICIYCPDTDECYYIRPTDHGVSVNLRIAPTKNGQQKRILTAASFRDLPDKHLPPIGETRTSA
ncbi:group I intron-associated PD-(D/E)XK endonuclease [Mycolicibacterium peregrinum]|uniref:group I intron-associated PD-(D/E)XK endonuclease n=1 Tax=Mycolicibacterium peregrinum TaxID=43304 RepID=UPI001F1C4C5C|nr:group I intron-associated PD-(D/E)XK endonuclease [Mycolicibacterium peregrinum]